MLGGLEEPSLSLLDHYVPQQTLVSVPSRQTDHQTRPTIPRPLLKHTQIYTYMACALT